MTRASSSMSFSTECSTASAYNPLTIASIISNRCAHGCNHHKATHEPCYSSPAPHHLTILKQETSFQAQQSLKRPNSPPQNSHVRLQHSFHLNAFMPSPSSARGESVSKTHQRRQPKLLSFSLPHASGRWDAPEGKLAGLLWSLRCHARNC